MKVTELLVFLECPKGYNLDSVILHPQSRREHLFQEALDILKNSFLQSKQWDDFSHIIRKHFYDSYMDSWFEVSWQKKKVIEDELFCFKRLYYWLQTNIKGKVIANKEFQMHYMDNLYEHPISRLEISSDLLVEHMDGSITGILFRRKLENKRIAQKKKPGKIIMADLELLILMQCFVNAYPEKQVQVMRICTESLKDTKDSFAVFEESSGDNILSFTKEEYLSGVENNAENYLKSAIRERKLNSCKNCRYENICRSATNICLKGEPLKGKKCNSIIYTNVQKQAITHKEGPMRVCAGPGAGKTETLVARIKCLIESGVDPKKILVVTFTRKAAKEILDRAENEKKPRVETLHALGFSIIRMNEGFIGKKRLVNRVDCMEMLKKILQQVPVLPEITYMQLTGRNGLLERLLFDFMFIEKHGASQFMESFPEKDAKGIFLIKEIYDQRFRRAGYIMYEDQIQLAVSILEKFPVVREKMKEMFEYILVDEAQDLDEMQIRMLQLLVRAPENNIAIYGDTDQSIYGFRGSSNRFMLEFLEIYRNAVDIRLDTNFRSENGIFFAANKLIRHNSERVDYQNRVIHGNERKPILVQDFIQNQIGYFVNQIRGKGYSLGDIAIIARTNKELESICILFEMFNKEHPNTETIIYEKPKYYMYQDFVFQTLLDLLEIYRGNYCDDMVWYRLFQAQEVTPAKADISRSIYCNYVDQKLAYPFDNEEAMRYLCVTGQDENILQVFAKIYCTIQYFQLPLEKALPKVIEHYIDPHIESGEMAEILGDMIRERGIQNATELWMHLNAMKQYEDTTRISYENVQKDKIHLLTAHDSKGKEFPVVLVYGVDDMEGNNQQEDRRLLYVAMTRAKERLYLTERCKGKSSMIKELGDSVEIMEGVEYA